MSRKIIRYDSYYDHYVVMDEGEVFLIDKNDIEEVLSEVSDYHLVIHEENPDGALSMPIKVQLQATRKCNLRCRTCAVNAENNSTAGELNFELGEHILKELFSQGVLHIEWSGGEPLINKYLFPLARQAYNFGFEQNLLTNGLMLTKNNINEIEDLFHRIQVSLDGVGQSYNNIVGKNVWRRLDQCFRILKESNVKDIVVATVLQEHNLKNMHEILDYLYTAGIKKWRISMQVPIGRSKGVTWRKYSHIIDIFREMWPELKTRAHDLGIEADCFLEKIWNDDPHVKDVGNLISPGGYSYLYITSEADVYPFPFLIGPELYVGNLWENNLWEMWHRSPALNFLRNQTYKNTGCGDCRWECAFHERATIYGFTSRLDKPALPHSECNLSINLNQGGRV